MTVQRIKSCEADGVLANLFAMGWTDLRPLPAPTPGGSAGKHWLILADGSGDSWEGSMAGTLARRHAELAGRCTLVWLGDQFRPLGAGERRLDLLGADEYELPLGDTRALDRLLGLVAAEAGQISDVFNFWTLSPSAWDDDPLQGLMAAQPAGAYFLPTLVQAITRAGWTKPPRLWLITEGTQNLPGSAPGFAPGANLAGATVWGMGRTLTREHPELATVLIDLSPKPQDAAPEPDEVDAIVRLALDERGQQVNSPTWENQVAFRGKLRFAGRVTRCHLPAPESTRRAVSKDESWRLETEAPGALDQLQFRVVPTAPPAAGEVRIQIAAAGLNFIDVTKALGIYPGLDPRAPIQMGGECSGRIDAVGADVSGLQVGQDVVALTPSPTRVGMLASHVNVPASLVLPLPGQLSAAQAASLPIAYLTAHYSLNELARLREGEWVLIHAGAGGVGLAAAKIALAKGARVIATASSPEKHAFLHAWGVEHVLGSRSLDFAEGVVAITGGRGVDVVLNSLSGDFIPRSMDVLAPYGRFIELGKRDIYEDRRVGLKAFRHNIAYFAVDLAALIEDKREYAAAMFREVMEQVAAGTWAALPVQVFPVNEAVEAFQFMAQGRHIGKLALACEELAGLQALPVKTAGEQPLFRRDATYLLTGGLGGVGAAVAEWMAEQGAGHMVLVSRRATGPAEEETLGRVRARGAMVEHHRTDLLDAAAVMRLMHTIHETLPPLRGVFHAAAVIDDALVDNMSPERFDAVFAPKIRGTWNLHQATLDLPLDCFVMFSSFASVFPQPGHGSYAAANSFMDAFAGYRRSLGLAGSSINWAGWLGLGLARETGTSRTIEAYEGEGFGSFQKDEALSLLGNALRANPVQVLAVSIAPEKLVVVHESVPPLFREVAGRAGADQAGKQTASDHPQLDELKLLATYADKLDKLESILRVEVSRVLKLSPDRIASNQAFGQMGIDSLMALEFVRRVNGVLGLALPATAVFNYPTITVLAGQVAKRLGFDPVGEGESATPVMMHEMTSEIRTDAGAVVDISEEEALRALMEPSSQAEEGAGGD
jgi:phthiocerol/phenolphthiocerol synthesis type-I polyketide synthase C